MLIVEVDSIKWSNVVTKDDERIKDPRSTGRKRARAILIKLVEAGERDYCCGECGLIPEKSYKENSRSGGLDANHKNKNWMDNDPENLEWLCRKCHYEKDRATARGVSAIEDEFGYGI